ncbi:MAG: HEAT repeat domain-containing protein [Deltaproteobacteria bacterium]|nr:HEAT repeat domain-containing protein [Deltaproteobacteria bacterium]
MDEEQNQPSDEIQDLSVFDDDPATPDLDLTDEQAMKQIGRHTTPFGRVVGLLMVVGVGVLGYWAYQSNQSSEHRADRLDEIAQIDSRPEMLAALREELGNTNFTDIEQRVIMNLGHFKDADAVPLLITKLDEPGVVRRSAAWALGEIGLPAAADAKAKLLQVLPETDARDHAQVVWTLAKLDASEASDAIVAAVAAGQLQAMDDFDPKVITDVLGPSRLGSDELIGNHSEAVRIMVAHALAEAANSSVVAPLSSMLDKELALDADHQSPEVIRAVAAGLGRTNDPAAAQPLFRLLTAKPNMEATVIDSLGKSVGAPGLATLLGQTQDTAVRRDLVRLLAASHDPRAADTLAGLLDDPEAEIKHTAAFALADLGDRRAMPALLLIAQDEEDDTLATRALALIRSIATPEDAPALLEIFPRFPYRKAMLLRALGATKSPDAVRTVSAELAGDDVRAAALAMADIGDDRSFRTLLDLVKRPRDVDMAASNAADRSLPNEMLLSKRKSAILAMGRFGRPEAFDALVTVIEDDHDDYELRAMAASSIGMFATDEQLAQVLTKIHDATLPENTRRYYTQSLWQKPHPELDSQLLDLMASEQPREIRRAAALAVGYAGRADNDERLMAMLDSENGRREAAFAILLGGGHEAVHHLLEVLHEDRDLKEVLQQNVLNTENDWFNLITEQMFETGAVWRRLKAAWQMKNGLAGDAYSYPWTKLVHVLRSGWQGTGGASPRFIREQLWSGITGDDDVLRTVVAHTFMDMPERGLLIRARDTEGPTSEAARAVLLEASRPHE